MLFYRHHTRDNIALGDPSINDHMVLRAATLAGAADFVRRNPAGFGAQVGEQGRNLSGGRRQAVGLARALGTRSGGAYLWTNPPAIWTPILELLVQKRLASIPGDKTLIIITHRLSMLRIVDRLVVMEEGRIALDGPRDEVLNTLRGKPAATPFRPQPAIPASESVLSRSAEKRYTTKVGEPRPQMVHV